jgi:hypothetical protein
MPPEDSFWMAVDGPQNLAVVTSLLWTTGLLQGPLNPSWSSGRWVFCCF